MPPVIPRSNLDELDATTREALLARSSTDLDAVAADVEQIVSTVRTEGDSAIREFTRRFDGVDPASLAVDPSAIQRAYDDLPPAVIEAIESAAAAIETYYERQLPEEWIATLSPGVEAGQLVRPLETVGCYAPGGTARYPSSVLMTAVPAAVAGVDTVVVSSPPDEDGMVDPATLVAADIAGVDTVYAVGGAQAIAAMAYGTETVPTSQAIVGPGNVYVTAAKRLVARDVDIDVLAGPTEVLIIADGSATPEAIAWDMIAQSEHDPDCASILVTPDASLASAVQERIDAAMGDVERADVVASAFAENGHILVCDSLAEAVAFSNDYAPEHLQVMTTDAEVLLADIRHAGTIFLGPSTTTSAGDYAIGPSHVLPTGGEAKRRSGISIYDFIRTPSVQRVSPEGLAALAETIETLAEFEGLSAHAEAVRAHLGER